MKKTSGVTATACYSDADKKEIPVAIGKDGVLVRIPAFGADTGKFIPHVVIESGTAASAPNTKPVVVQANWADWDIASGQAPSGAEISESGVTQGTYGRRMKGSADSNILVGGPSVQFKKKIYLECVIKFHKLPDEGETQLIYARNAAGGMYGRSIDLRHTTAANCLYWLVASQAELANIGLAEVPILVGQWYHILAYYDGAHLVLNVNDKETRRDVVMPLVQYGGTLQVGAGLDCTLAYLRIGGE